MPESREQDRVNVDCSVQVPAFEMPFSSYASAEMRAAFAKQIILLKAIGEQISRHNLNLQAAFDQYFYPDLIARQHARYDVAIARRTIAGVYTEVFTPADGIAGANADRVLINLHGGGFVLGARTGGQVESIPVAAEGRLKVISVNYRQGPEHRFPAASEDVARVYQALLTEYRAQNIGIFGGSAGGLLAGQVLAWLQGEGLPMPGAVGMFGLGMGPLPSGDSAYLGLVLRGMPIPPGGAERTLDTTPYLTGADFGDPLVNPLQSAAVLAKFPPTLLLNGTRDTFWSSSVHTHNQLVKAGVEADLHLWEGGSHCFFYDPDLPESAEAYRVMVNFFAKHLGG